MGLENRKCLKIYEEFLLRKMMMRMFLFRPRTTEDVEIRVKVYPYRGLSGRMPAALELTAPRAFFSGPQLLGDFAIAFCVPVENF